VSTTDGKKLARLEVVADRTKSSRCDEGFLRLRRLRLVNHYADGTSSREYSCDIVSRPGTDAVAAVLWNRRDGKIWVHLRKGTRAAIYLRRDKRAELVQPDDREFDSLEELVAGILEPDDKGPLGIARRGAIEAHEEAGFRVDPAKVRVLGAGFFPTPGVTDEKVYLVDVEVDPRSAGAIEGDGSVMEEDAGTLVREFRDAIAACRRGDIVDAKCEIGLLRLADAIGYLPQLGLFVEELPPELRARYRPLGLSSDDKGAT
jgi:ADP-ribose pyrophosphatase